MIETLVVRFSQVRFSR